ncbi:methyltransferase domain-containing protein [Caldilinea sp.]|uniref:methyltransferase domain-containing protein n=1 Tax=Caldilinea sp. TaxID=2293560 RepID=UPI002635355D|nr:methyltransferase domain-containing protein [Caldilinea sp.]
MRLLLICHAEGMQNRYTGLVQRGESIADSGLTAFGWEQTTQLAQWLATHETIDVLYSAPLLQSRLTAQRIGQTLGLPVTVNERIPGRFPSDLALPGMWDRNERTILHFDPPASIPPDSPYGIYLHSLIEELDAIIQANWGKSIAIVLSGNAVATTVRHFAGAHGLPIAVSHTAITELRRQDGVWSLVYVNRREHLPVGMAPAPRQRTATLNVDNGGEIAQDIARIVAAYGRASLQTNPPRNAKRIQRLQHLLKFAQLPKGLSVLDVGCGSGELSLLLAEEGAREVVGIDISPAMLEAAEFMRLSSRSPAAARVSFRLAPAHALPFRDERFDAAVCRLVLHHNHRPQLILEEIARVLKHGGVLILADLLSTDDPVKRATQNAIEEKRDPSHVAIFSAEQYRKLVVGAGFAIEAEQVAVFERELEEWLDDMYAEPETRTVVREMIEAGLETDAAGLHARRQGDKLFFEQRLFYIKAVKP